MSFGAKLFALEPLGCLNEHHRIPRGRFFPDVVMVSLSDPYSFIAGQEGRGRCHHAAEATVFFPFTGVFLARVFPEIMGKTTQIIHLFIGFSVVFTIHFGSFPSIFGNTHKEPGGANGST